MVDFACLFLVLACLACLADACCLDSWLYWLLVLLACVYGWLLFSWLRVRSMVL